MLARPKEIEARRKELKNDQRQKRDDFAKATKRINAAEKAGKYRNQEIDSPWPTRTELKRATMMIPAMAHIAPESA